MSLYGGLEDMDELEEKRQKMQEKEIDDIVKMLDSKTTGGVSRIKVEVSEKQKEGTVSTKYHHGRCDVGSPWATGEVRNFGGCD